MNDVILSCPILHTQVLTLLKYPVLFSWGLFNLLPSGSPMIQVPHPLNFRYLLLWRNLTLSTSYPQRPLPLLPLERTLLHYLQNPPHLLLSSWGIPTPLLSGAPSSSLILRWSKILLLRLSVSRCSHLHRKLSHTIARV